MVTVRPTKRLSYDADIDRNASDWLNASEDRRIDAVRRYHHRQHVQLPNARLHAALHVIVENQIALGETVVVEALERLQAEGLGRHDAIHAIGTVLVEHMHRIVTTGEVDGREQARYFERLKVYSADDWLRSG